MKYLRVSLLIALSSVSTISFAEHLIKDAAIGGGLGGALGGAVGAEIGGRNGAIMGSAVGAAIGTAVVTDKNPSDKAHKQPKPSHISDQPGYGGQPRYRHCPPGQAKKGRC